MTRQEIRIGQRGSTDQAPPTERQGGPRCPGPAEPFPSSTPSQAWLPPLPSSSPPARRPTEPARALCAAAGPCAGPFSAPARRQSLEQQQAAPCWQGRVRNGPRRSQTASLEGIRGWRLTPSAPLLARGSATCRLPCVGALPALGDTWLQIGHWHQLDEVPTVEAEEAPVISDVASQGDNVARVLRPAG